MHATPFSKTTVCRLLQDAKALEPISVTLPGMTMELIEVPAKARLARVDNRVGSTTDVRPVHSEKAESYMVVTLSGRVMLPSFVQLQKAYPPMVVTPFLMVTEESSLQL